MKKISFIISILLCSTAAFAQEKSDSSGGIRKNAISFNFLGTTPFIGITYERIVSDHVSLEVGVGLPSIGIGAKIFFTKIQEQKMMFNTGLTATYVDFGKGVFIAGSGVIIYVPIGLSYYGSKGFNFGIDVGPGINTGHKDGTIIIPYAGLKLGRRF